MLSVVQAIQSLDLNIYEFFNRFVGNYTLDRCLAHLEGNGMVKGGVFLTLYWYFWFRQGPQQTRHRRSIVATMGGTILAIIVTRMLASALPFRTRPLFESHLTHLLSLQVSGFEAWSSFPSDTAAYICALAIGLMYLSRRIRIPIALYTVAFVCVPRVYLGIHYFSDVAVAVAIAAVSVWTAQRLEGMQPGFANRLLAFIETKPEWFYAAGFLVSYEMAAIFWDIREPLNAMMKVARAEHFHTQIHSPKFAGAAICTLAVAVYMRWKSRFGQPA